MRRDYKTTALAGYGEAERVADTVAEKLGFRHLHLPMLPFVAFCVPIVFAVTPSFAPSSRTYAVFPSVPDGTVPVFRERFSCQAVPLVTLPGFAENGAETCPAFGRRAQLKDIGLGFLAKKPTREYGGLFSKSFGLPALSGCRQTAPASGG
jgi:hypothetical protein